MNSINYMDTSNLELSQIDDIIQEIRTTMDDETQMQSFYEHLKNKYSNVHIYNFQLFF